MQRAAAIGVTFEDSSVDPTQDDLVVDALLGLGTTRAPEGSIAEAVRSINRGAAPVLAVDLPTGLHADSGQPLGAAVARAQATLSLLTLKPGLFTGQGRDLAGAVWLDRLGVDANGTTASWPRARPPASAAMPSTKAASAILP